MIPHSIIVLIGVPCSGKSRTLHAMADSHKAKNQSHAYSFSRRRTCIYFSSPQEYSDCHFCDYTQVNATVDSWIATCRSQSCDLLIGAFSIRANRQGELNEKCIMMPIENLNSRRFNVIPVYLRKDSSIHIGQVKNLIGRLRVKATIMSNENYPRQARELLDVVKSAP